MLILFEVEGVHAHRCILFLDNFALSLQWGCNQGDTCSARRDSQISKAAHCLSTCLHANAWTFLLFLVSVSVHNCSPHLLHSAGSLSRVRHLHVFTHTLVHLAKQLRKRLHSDANICLTGIWIQIWHTRCSPKVSWLVSVCRRSAASMRKQALWFT